MLFEHVPKRERRTGGSPILAPRSLKASARRGSGFALTIACVPVTPPNKSPAPNPLFIPMGGNRCIPKD
jgi:hypothetical protein